jgi:hypothetical protein
MTTWTMTVADGKVTYSPIGMRLIDELTNQVPIGNVYSFLDIKDASGVWRETGIQSSRNTDAVLAYPGLERHATVTGLQPPQYRVRLKADFYIPYYLINADGIVFNAYPYNDTNPPAQVVTVPTDTPLLPATNYPFAPQIPVLRGIVVDASGKAVANASVSQGNTERVLSDAQGQFALPLRWVQQNTLVPIDASDARTARTGSIHIQIPAALGKSQKISIG